MGRRKRPVARKAHLFSFIGRGDVRLKSHLAWGNESIQRSYVKAKTQVSD
jgi:hypothetical protein